MSLQDQYPTRHTREETYEKAKNSLLLYLIDWQKEHKLTSAEYLKLLSEQVSYYLGMLVSKERNYE